MSFSPLTLWAAGRIVTLCCAVDANRDVDRLTTIFKFVYVINTSFSTQVFRFREMRDYYKRILSKQ